ncbi:DUF2809 domain-containing protein [Flavobacterium sp. GT2N3]|uniref:ribosomal maturation YjgA family protein n=1 Tax=unclassified Flavobacterium TaxID=196869 RepID=UPI003AACFE69
MLYFNLKYFTFTVLFFLVEIAIAWFVHDNFIRPYFGDFLVVMLLYSFLKAFVNVSVWLAASLVLVFAFAIEIAQYFKTVEILGLQHSQIATAVLGSSFAWMDLLAYILGISSIIFIEKCRFKTRS